MRATTLLISALAVVLALGSSEAGAAKRGKKKGKKKAKVTETTEEASEAPPAEGELEDAAAPAPEGEPESPAPPVSEPGEIEPQAPASEPEHPAPEARPPPAAPTPAPEHAASTSTTSESSSVALGADGEQTAGEPESITAAPAAADAEPAPPIGMDIALQTPPPPVPAQLVVRPSVAVANASQADVGDAANIRLRLDVAYYPLADLGLVIAGDIAWELYHRDYLSVDPGDAIPDQEEMRLGGNVGAGWDFFRGTSLRDLGLQASVAAAFNLFANAAFPNGLNGIKGELSSHYLLTADLRVEGAVGYTIGFWGQRDTRARDGKPLAMVDWSAAFAYRAGELVWLRLAYDSDVVVREHVLRLTHRVGLGADIAFDL